MYYNRKIEDIIKELEANSQGLSKAEVARRQQKYGPNILPAKKLASVLNIFFHEFRDPMIIMLLIAILISFVVGEVTDAVVIILIVIIDALMGTYQENKANHTADALQKLVTTKAKVLRDNDLISINAEELTIGDYVLLESGDKISADLRIIEAHNLTVNESILTGESLEVTKNNATINKEFVTVSEQSNMLFSGTTVVRGRAKGIVVNIGLKTELGKIAESLNNTTKEDSPLTIRVKKLSRQISALVLIIAIITTIILISKGTPYNEIFLSVIALSISAMPEGLPLALTMALSIATSKMAQKNVIVRKLKSAESLGSCTVIASDKTGTITINEQTAQKILLPNNEEYDITSTGFKHPSKYSKENLELAKEIALLGFINNEADVDEYQAVGDGIDIAFKFLGQKLHLEPTNINILEVIPYESENKYSALFYEKDGEVYCTVKGSLEVVKSFCNQISLTKDLNFSVIEEQNERLAQEGYRLISLASGQIKKQTKYSLSSINNLTFKGMVGFIDPIRKEVSSSIKSCHSAGIKVIMITGDHPLTAFSISQELNLTHKYSELASGEELAIELEKGEENFDTFIKDKVVFARVTPLQKLKIIESLKRQGEFVAVTGDGVNDAPALKSANIGIAMGSGSDIARETADMIIADDNFKSIVVGIKEGRVAYANIRKIILFLISCGLSEVIFFCLSLILNLPLPLLAIQLLWLNVVTDGIQDFALSFESAEKDILQSFPKSPKESIFNKELLQAILISGIAIGTIVFIVWYFLIRILNMDIFIARGYIMALMVFIQNVHVFNCRSEHHSAFNIPLKNNWLIVIGVACSIILQIIVMEIPFLSNLLQTSSIPFIHLIYLFIISLLVLIVMEFYKKVNYQKRNNYIYLAKK